MHGMENIHLETSAQFCCFAFCALYFSLNSSNFKNPVTEFGRVQALILRFRLGCGAAYEGISNLEDKGGDTLSSRHVSSCDITRVVGM